MQELNVLPEVLAKVLAQPQIVALIALLVVGAVIDWRTYRIPNWLTVGGAAFALIHSALSATTWHAGLLAALAGLGVGLVSLLPLYVLRVMGAGDVKLMAMVGAFLGTPDILFAVLWTFIAGGVAAVAFALWHRAFARMATNIRDVVQSMAFAAATGQRSAAGIGATRSIGNLPYGISISAGTIAWLAARQLGYV